MTPDLSSPTGGVAAHVDPATLSGLPNVIGQDRLQKYAVACGGDFSKAVRLYTWNVEASAAFLGAFAALEVGLRNAMHTRLTAQASTASWWTQLQFSSDDEDLIDQALRELNRKKPGAWTPGHLVAELRFGFWVGLLANKYHSRFWEKGLTQAFPGYPTGSRRAYLHESFDRLRLLRNRAAHHEPIHARDLMIDHKLMCELAGYLDVDLEAWIESHTRLPAVVAGRGTTLTTTRPTSF